jgi:hypothetical protein
MKVLFYNLLFLVFIASCTQSSEQQQITGVVFHDLNANGIRDEGEPGISGVAVSNGADAVLTDQNGNYTLGISDDAIIFVIKPGNYNYPVNEYNLPQFYYIHKPNGYSDLEYPGVEPTGSLPSSVDFALLTGSDSDEFSILVFSDPQSYTEEQISYYDRSIVEELAGVQGHAFGITLGDIVGDNLDFFEPTNHATARIGLPWFHVFGNHDMNFDTEIQQHADETFERVYGPANYAFNHGKVHFIVLDNVIYPNEYTNWKYVGGLREDQFRFIENTLKHVPEDYLVVLNMHIPIFNEAPWGETFLNSHKERLFHLLQNHPFTFSLSGHTHTQRHHYFDGEDGWKNADPHHHYNVGTSSGDWWSGEYRDNGTPYTTMRDGTPQGYNILHFNGNTYSYDYIVVGESEDYKMRIYGPKAVPRNQHFRGEFYVNFFQGSEKDTVEFRVNDGEWRSMRYFIEQDPHISAMRYIWDHAETLPEGTRPSNPVNCYHLWKARVPTNVPAGENTIHVRVKDKLGRVYESSWKFEAVEGE